MKPSLAFGALVALFAFGARGEDLPRAVSLDYCADQFLIALAAPGQIAAVSPGADQDYSRLRAFAEDLKEARPSAEEILVLKPNIALRFWGGAPRLSEALERAGVEVLTLGYADDFGGVRENISIAATALGREAEGAALIADLDARLAALAAGPKEDRPALYVTPGGVTAGAGTMIDAIFAAAGVRNAAAEAGLSYWPPLPAEALVRNPPALIVAGFFEGRHERTNHWSAARHPAFARIFEATPTIHLSADVLSCPAWYSVDAAELIAREAARTRGSDGAP